MPKKLDCRLKINKSKKSCVNRTKSSKKKNCPKNSRRNPKTGRCVKSKSVKSRKSTKLRKSTKSKKTKKSVRKKSRKSTKSKKSTKKLFKFIVNVYKNDIDNNANYTYKNPSKLSEKKKSY